MTGEPVFVTGGTGYLGRALIETLLARGYPVHALARRGSEARLPLGARVAVGDALDAESFAAAIPARAGIGPRVLRPYIRAPGRIAPVPVYGVMFGVVSHTYGVFGTRPG